MSRTVGQVSALVHGDHDVRFLDGSLEEAYSIAGRPVPASVRLAYDRGLVYYCPRCLFYSISPYSTQPMGVGSSKDSAVLEARCGFLSAPDSCESTRRMKIAQDIMEA